MRIWRIQSRLTTIRTRTRRSLALERLGGDITGAGMAMEAGIMEAAIMVAALTGEDTDEDGTAANKHSNNHCPT